MSLIVTIFNELLYRPLFNGLVFLYNNLPGHDFGLAIIALTIIIRFLMYPLFQKSIKAQRELALLQPKIKQVQKKYEKDKEKQAKALMELYKEHKVNPMSGCLPILIQLPIFYAFFRVLQTGLDPATLDGLYSFIKNPGAINPMFLGLIDLSQRSVVLAVLAGAAQFVQSKMALPKPAVEDKQDEAQFDFAKVMSTQMVYMMPILIVLIGLNFAAGLPLYWLVITLFSIGQQYLSFGFSLRAADSVLTREQEGAGGGAKNGERQAERASKQTRR